jgi:hypothetical protein
MERVSRQINGFLIKLNLLKYKIFDANGPLMICFMSSPINLLLSSWEIYYPDINNLNFSIWLLKDGWLQSSQFHIHLYKHQLPTWMPYMLSSLTLDKYLQPLFPIWFSAVWMIDGQSASWLRALQLTFEK